MAIIIYHIFRHLSTIVNKATKEVRKINYSALKSRAVAELKRRGMTYADLGVMTGYKESTIRRFMADNIAGYCNSPRVAKAVENAVKTLKEGKERQHDKCNGDESTS